MLVTIAPRASRTCLFLISMVAVLLPACAAPESTEPEDTGAADLRAFFEGTAPIPGAEGRARHRADLARLATRAAGARRAGLDPDAEDGWWPVAERTPTGLVPADTAVWQRDGDIDASGAFVPLRGACPPRAPVDLAALPPEILAPSPRESGSAGEERGSAGEERGSAGEERGSAGEERGSAGEERGSAGEERGSAGEGRGSAGEERGSAGEERGSAGGERGSADEERGSADEERGSADQGQSSPGLDERAARLACALDRLAGEEVRVAWAPGQSQAAVLDPEGGAALVNPRLLALVEPDAPPRRAPGDAPPGAGAAPAAGGGRGVNPAPGDPPAEPLDWNGGEDDNQHHPRPPSNDSGGSSRTFCDRVCDDVWNDAFRCDCNGSPGDTGTGNDACDCGGSPGSSSSGCGSGACKCGTAQRGAQDRAGLFTAALLAAALLLRRRSPRRVSRSTNGMPRADDVASRADDVASRTDDDASRTIDVASRTDDDAPRTADDASRATSIPSRAIDVASRATDIAPRTTDIAPRTADAASCTVDVASRTVDVASRAVDFASRTDDAASCTVDVASRTVDVASRAVDFASRTDDDASRTVNVASRTDDDASRTDDDASRDISVLSRAADDASRTADVAPRTADAAYRTDDDASRTIGGASRAAGARSVRVLVPAHELSMRGGTGGASPPVSRSKRTDSKITSRAAEVASRPADLMARATNMASRAAGIASRAAGGARRALRRFPWLLLLVGLLPALLAWPARALAGPPAKLVDVHVTVSPAEAAVFVDGNAVTPERGVVRLPAGSHTFSAKLEGYSDATQTVDVQGGGTGTLVTLRLVANQGYLVITSRDPAAVISIDGARVGQGSYSGLVAPGNHVITAADAAGRPRSYVVTAIAGQSVSMSADGPPTYFPPPPPAAAPPPPPMETKPAKPRPPPPRGPYVAVNAAMFWQTGRPYGFEHGDTPAPGFAVGGRGGYRFTEIVGLEALLEYARVANGGVVAQTYDIDQDGDGAVSGGEAATDRSPADYTLEGLRIGPVLRLTSPGRENRFLGGIGLGALHEQISLNHADLAWDAASARYTSTGTYHHHHEGWSPYLLFEGGYERSIQAFLAAVLVQITVESVSGIDGEPYNSSVQARLGLCLRAGWSAW